VAAARPTLARPEGNPRRHPAGRITSPCRKRGARRGARPAGRRADAGVGA